MKKVFISLFLIFISISVVTGQEAFHDLDDDSFFDNIDNKDIEASDELAESDSFDEFDDFDSIFDDAADVENGIVEEKDKNANAVVQVIASAFSSMVRFSGNFSADVGMSYTHVNEGKFAAGFTIKNTLNMTISPLDCFYVRGGLYTGYDNGFALAVTELYFDYFILYRVFLSAGKKGLSWGYTRLFNNGSYYGCGTVSGCLYSTGPLYTNICVGDGSPLCLEIRYPWATGTITFAATGNFNGDVKLENFNYYGSLEFSVLNTSINLFAKKPAGSADSTCFLGGLEVKKTILGFDTYFQGICRVNDIKMFKSSSGYDYIVGTLGLYRLWDEFDPNIGVNLEYQYEFNPKGDRRHNHRLAFEGGIKRLGNKKNMKIGIISHFNITERHGYTGLSFVASGILPYVDWSTSGAVGYGAKYGKPVFTMSTGLSLALDY